MEKALIVAKASNHVIGNQGQLPWHLPDDLLFFKKITSQHAIIMGRKTYLSIGRPLPNRLNIVLTRNPTYQPNKKCLVARTLEEAFLYAQQANMSKAFVIGGAQVYEESLPIVDKLYITAIDGSFKGDTYFPNVNWPEWTLLREEKHKQDHRHPVSFTFLLYQRVLPGGNGSKE